MKILHIAALVTCVLISLIIFCKIRDDDYIESYGTATERTRNVHNISEPMFVADHCTITDAATAAQYTECKMINNIEVAHKIREHPINLCGVIGGYCTRYDKVNCKPCYYNCKLECNYEDVSGDCKYGLNDRSCDFNSNMFGYISYHCKQDIDPFLKRICERCSTNAPMICKPENFNCGCTDVCVDWAPYKICEIRDVFLITITKVRYYTVDGVEYINEIKHQCSSEDITCIHNFLNDNTERIIRYPKGSPDKGAPDIPIGTYRILLIIVAVLLVLSLIWLAYAIYEWYYKHHGYQPITST